MKKGSLDEEQFPFLIENRQALLSRNFDELLSKVDTKKATKYFNKLKACPAYNPDETLASKMRSSAFLTFSEEKRHEAVNATSCVGGDIVNGRTPVTRSLLETWALVVKDAKLKKS